MSKRILNLWGILFLCLLAGGCEKSGFLDERPDNALVVPKTLTDLQALLDNDFIMNGLGGNGLLPGLGETGADSYTTSDHIYNDLLKPTYRNSYVWAKDVYGEKDVPDWSFPYRAVFYANIALSGLQTIASTAATQAAWNNVAGSAFFYRAHMFYQLAQVFAPPYDSATAASQAGIPLRMQADINEAIHRASVADNYRQIIADLQSALPLLPVVPRYQTRPSKAAAYALLARTYLAMGDYQNCLLCADSSLQLKASLMDYNMLDTALTYPFGKFNEEVLHSAMIVSADLLPIVPTDNIIDSSLYQLYDSNDLRKQLFFTTFSGYLSFTGTYDEQYYLFGGIATDEVWLMRAECYARAGNIAAAMSDLNTLLVKRFVTGSFVPLTAQSAEVALDIVLRERRKELLMRGLRWTDLRRLNRDPRYAVTLTRSMDGTTYTLPPNDARYVYPIPDAVIAANPGMEQNAR